MDYVSTVPKPNRTELHGHCGHCIWRDCWLHVYGCGWAPLGLPTTVAAGFRGFPHGIGVMLCLQLKCMVMMRAAGYQMAAPPSRTCKPARVALENQARTVGMHGSSGEAWLASWN